MTTLIESGRAKQDAELSYSSFSNQAEPAPVQQPHTVSSERKQRIVENSGENWSTKLSSVALSIGFDLSVFATHDRCGRLTLHPVLRAVDRQQQQQKVQLGDGQDCGRNNCARTAQIYQQETSDSPNSDCGNAAVAASSCRQPQLKEPDATKLCAESSKEEAKSSNSTCAAARFAAQTDSAPMSKFHVSCQLMTDSPARSKARTWSPQQQEIAREKSKLNHDRSGNHKYSGTVKQRRRDGYASKASKQMRGPSPDLPPGTLAVVVEKLEALLAALDPRRVAAAATVADYSSSSSSSGRSSTSRVSSSAMSTASRTESSAIRRRRQLHADSSLRSRRRRPTESQLSVSELQLEFDRERRH